jgi:hypothetical protein
MCFMDRSQCEGAPCRASFLFICTIGCLESEIARELHNLLSQSNIDKTHSARKRYPNLVVLHRRRMPTYHL